MEPLHDEHVRAYHQHEAERIHGLWLASGGRDRWDDPVDYIMVAEWNGMRLAWLGNRYQGGESFDIVDSHAGRLIDSEELDACDALKLAWQPLYGRQRHWIHARQCVS